MKNIYTNSYIFLLGGDMSWIGAAAAGLGGGMVAGAVNPKWGQADEARQKAEEAKAHGREHVDNAGEAIRTGRPFEAVREVQEVAKSALETDRLYREANRLEAQAAQEQVIKATDYRQAQRDIDWYYARRDEYQDTPSERTESNERNDAFSRYDHSDQSGRSGGCINS